MNNTKNLLLIVGLFMSIGALAQDIKQFELDELLVNSSRLEQKVAETGKHLSIITAKEIQQLPINSIDELLRYVSGIETQSRNGFGVQSDISMRGSTFSQVLVLIDGMRLNDPLTAHFNNHIPISIAEIEQVEVLSGPAAAMYGPDAVGGVINIVSKTFSAKNDNNGFQTNGKVMGGENGLISTQSGAYYQNEQFRFGFGILNNQADGEELRNPNYPDSTVLYNNDFKVQTTSASLAYQINNDWSVHLRSAYDFRDFNAKYFYTASTFDESREIVKNWWNQLKVQHIGNTSQTSIDLTYKRTNDDFLFNPLFSGNVHTTQMGQFQVNHYHILNDDLKLNVGVQLGRRQIESNDRGEHSDNYGGIYAMAAYTLAENTTLSGSLRGDYDANFGFEINPQLNVSHRLNDLILRASAGRSIRAADYTERYISNNLPNLSANRNLGNPELEAETSWNTEIGADYYSDFGLRLSATVFRRVGNNLIDYVITNEQDIPRQEVFPTLIDNANYFFTQNLEEVTTTGLETELGYTRQFSDALGLNAILGYTFLNSSNDAEVLSKYISNHANHRLTATLDIAYDWVNWSVQLLHKNRNADFAESIGAELSENYTVLNTQLSLAIVPNKLFLNGQINNVFDKQYSDILGAPMPGRWFMGGIRWNLN